MKIVAIIKKKKKKLNRKFAQFFGDIFCVNFLASQKWHD